MENSDMESVNTQATATASTEPELINVAGMYNDKFALNKFTHDE